MEKIALIVQKLNSPPFNKGLETMTEFDSKSSLDLLDLIAEIVVAIDPEQEAIFKEPTEMRVQRIIQFLMVMKFHIPEGQMEDFESLLMNGDKEILHTIIHWCLNKFEHHRKRAYLAKYLMPVDVPGDFLYDDLIVELSERLKELQADFKEVHKQADQVRSTGARPADIKAEINQLEQEKNQLENKIRKMKKDMSVDEDVFKDMLKATSSLRKEQENEVINHERMREHRKAAQEADLRFSDASKRLSEMKSGGAMSQSAEQILNKLQADVRELNDRRENFERVIGERASHLDKLQSWDNQDRITTDDDVRMKREQVQDLEDMSNSLQERLDAALERNTKLVVFRQASSMALKKFREREDDVDKLTEELRRLNRQTEEKEQEQRDSGRQNSNKIGKKDLKKYGAVVRDKIEKYKKMREELSSLRSELVILQRTEQILKSRDSSLESYLNDLERQKGVEGYRETQQAIIEMTDKAAEVDALKGSTLEDISAMVEQISREFKQKQAQLQPLISELKSVRQEYMDVESRYQERKSTYDKVAVGLEMEKQTLEKDCNTFQDDCLREESRYHYLQNLITIAQIKIARADQEKKWQNNDGRLMRDFSSLKELYTNKIAQQEQLTKQMRKRQKELKENSGALTNQKSNFMNLHALMDMKLRAKGDEGGSGDGTGNTLSMHDSDTKGYTAASAHIVGSKGDYNNRGYDDGQTGYDQGGGNDDDGYYK